MRIISLNFRKNQRHRDKDGMWKTITPGELDVVELGEMDHYGTNCLVGINSKDILDISKVRRDISELETKNLNQRMIWFNDNYPSATPIMISTAVISGLDGNRKPDSETSVNVSGSFELTWSN